jgi:hypothetical protein
MSESGKRDACEDEAIDSLEEVNTLVESDKENKSVSTMEAIGGEKKRKLERVMEAAETGKVSGSASRGWDR